MASDKPAKNQISEFYQQAMKHAPDVGMPLFTTIQLRHTHEPIFRTTLKLPGMQHPLISFEEQVGDSVLVLFGHELPAKAYTISVHDSAVDNDLSVCLLATILLWCFQCRSSLWA